MVSRKVSNTRCTLSLASKSLHLSQKLLSLKKVRLQLGYYGNYIIDIDVFSDYVI